MRTEVDNCIAAPADSSIMDGPATAKPVFLETG